MNIIQAKSTDLVEILYLLKVCSRDMNSKGLRHWHSSFPFADQINRDIVEGSIYLIKDKGVCKGMITLNSNEPDDYRQMNLPPADTRPLFVHCLAVHPTWQGKGIAGLLIDFAHTMARNNGNTCIRLDIYQTSDEARQFCEKLSFRKIGTFQANYQRIPYVCYEKQI
jgi:ribosomal protein S18 acetylase RimI-like enzyme